MQARWKQGYDTGMTKEKEDVRFLKCYLRVFCESLLPDCVHHVTIYHPLSLNHLNSHSRYICYCTDAQGIRDGICSILRGYVYQIIIIQINTWQYT